MGQSGVGGTGSILGNLVARRTQLNAVRQKLGLTPGSDRGVPQGGQKPVAPVPPGGPAASAKAVLEPQPTAPTTPTSPAEPRQRTRAPRGTLPMPAGSRERMLAQATDFLNQVRQTPPRGTQQRPQSRGERALGRARQILSGGI